jgi:maltose alpha-D-glucosyltransferase/alpha-amylase
VLHRYVPNQGTAWQYTLDHLSGFFEHVAALSQQVPPSPPPGTPLIDKEGPPTPNGWHDLIGTFLESVRIIAGRTAEMHSTLGRIPDIAFTPEPFGKLYQRSIYQSLRTLIGRLVQRLSSARRWMPENARPLAECLLASESDILRRFRAVLDPSLGGSRIRCHGNYLLEQLFYTGKDFLVIDFEGEPGKAIGERRLKKSPLTDVASLVRSFDYAAQSVLMGLTSNRGRSAGLIREEDRDVLSAWAVAWTDHVTNEYVSVYFNQMAGAALLPSTDRGKTFLEVLVLEKALREVDLELTARPDWVIVPLRGVVRILGHDPNHPERPTQTTA